MANSNEFSAESNVKYRSVAPPGYYFKILENVSQWIYEDLFYNLEHPQASCRVQTAYNLYSSLRSQNELEFEELEAAEVDQMRVPPIYATVESFIRSNRLVGACD